MLLISSLEGKLRLNIQYSIIECYKHFFEKAIVYLNYHDDKYIDIMTEREKFEDIIEDFLLKNSGCYLALTYTEYRVNAKWFDHNNVAEFVLKRKTYITSITFLEYLIEIL